jgi:hypothetical protein
VLLEAEEVAHLRRNGDRREQAYFFPRKRDSGAGRLQKLGDRVERRVAGRDDVQHAAADSLQIRNFAVGVDQRTGTRRAVSHCESHESHGVF